MIARSFRAAGLAALLTLATAATPWLVATPALADDEPPPPVGLRRSESSHGTHLDIVVPGRLLGHAWPRLAPDASRTLLLLVAPENAPDGPRALYRVEPAADTTTTLVPVATDLPAEAHALKHVDAVQDGVDLVLLGEPSVIHRLLVPSDPGQADGVRTSVLAHHDGLDLRAQPASSVGHGLPLAEVGQLRVLPPGVTNLDDPSAWTESLPVRARRKRAGLVLESPPVSVLDRGAGRAPLYAVGPEVLGAQRLRTILIDPELVADERAQEIWSVLPGPESVEDSTYVIQDDRPRLLVTTINAEKMSLFGRKRLRSFPLLADRTRQGKRTAINVETTSRRWQTVDMVTVDANGDGQDDLIVGQYDGLGGGKVVVEAYLGTGSGRYEIRPHKTVIDRSIETWHLGHDFDGDGEPDLLARAGATLALYPGVVRTTKRRAVDTKPAWEIDLNEHAVVGSALPGDDEAETSVSIGTTNSVATLPSLGRPQLVDLNDDQHADLVLAHRNQRGRGRLHVVLLERE